MITRKPAILANAKLADSNDMVVAGTGTPSPIQDALPPAVPRGTLTLNGTRRNEPRSCSNTLSGRRYSTKPAAACWGVTSGAQSLSLVLPADTAALIFGNSEEDGCLAAKIFSASCGLPLASIKQRAQRANVNASALDRMRLSISPIFCIMVIDLYQAFYSFECRPFSTFARPAEY